MIQFKNILEINRPVDEVFSFIADFRNLPKWNYFVQKVEKTSSGPIGISTTYHQVRKTDEQQFKITVYEPHHRVSIQTISTSPSLTLRFTLNPEGNGTHLVDEWELESELFGPLDWLASAKVKSAVAAPLSKHKQLLETGQTHLQDGWVTHVEV